MRVLLVSVLLLFLSGCQIEVDPNQEPDPNPQPNPDQEPPTNDDPDEDDKIALTITQRTPDQGVEVSDMDSRIRVEFDQQLTSTTGITLELENENEQTVSGELSFSGNAVVFEPSNPLMEGMDYQASLTILDDGPYVGSDSEWSFSTEIPVVKTDLTLSSVQPANQQTLMEIPSSLVVDFDQELTTTSGLSLTVSDGTANVPGSLSIESANLVFTPDSALEFENTYTASMEIDADGPYAGDDVQWAFTLEAPATKVSLSVASYLPANNQLVTDEMANVSITFNETLTDESGLTLSVSDANGEIAGVVSFDGANLIFNPDNNLMDGTAYTVAFAIAEEGPYEGDNMNWGFQVELEDSGGAEFAACGSSYFADYNPILGKHNESHTPSQRPTKGVAVMDPVYGTCVVRATNHASETDAGFLRNDYSRRQAFNADSTRFLAYALDGHWHLFNAETLAWMRILNGPAADAEPQWHPTNPDLLYYIPNLGGMEIRELNVETNNWTQVADFTGKLPWANAARVWTKSEGSPSADARYWGFQVETSSFAPLGLMVWDMVTSSVVGTYDFAEHGLGRPDHVSMSPTGDYIVASWDGNDKGTTAFYRDFTSEVKVHHKSEHSDIALLPNGNDAYVAVDYQSNAGDVFMVELQTGEKTVLFESYVGGTGTAFHFSGKGFNVPGWVLVSTYSSNAATQWLHQKIYAVTLEENPQIVNLGHHHSVSTGYWTEPHATVNRDFTRVLFSSNWDVSSANDIDAYMMIIPEDVF